MNSMASPPFLIVDFRLRIADFGLYNALQALHRQSAIVNPKSVNAQVRRFDLGVFAQFLGVAFQDDAPGL